MPNENSDGSVQDLPRSKGPSQRGAASVVNQESGGTAPNPGDKQAQANRTSNPKQVRDQRPSPATQSTGTPEGGGEGKKK